MYDRLRHSADYVIAAQTEEYKEGFGYTDRFIASAQEEINRYEDEISYKTSVQRVLYGDDDAFDFIEYARHCTVDGSI